MNVEEQIIKHEGFSPVVYKDSLGFLTLGIGRLVDFHKGGGITREEAIYLLRNDISRIEQQLSSLAYYRSLNEPRRAVLIDMVFQLGFNGLLNFKNTLKFIQIGDYENAAKEMLDSNWAKQTPVRAKELSEQMKTGAWS